MNTSHDMHHSPVAAAFYNALGAVAIAWNLTFALMSTLSWMQIASFTVGLLAGLTTVIVNLYRTYTLRRINEAIKKPDPETAYETVEETDV